MYLSSSTKYIVMYLSTFLKLKYKVQASTRKNVLGPNPGPGIYSFIYSTMVPLQIS